jgi:hypothetical protein
VRVATYRRAITAFVEALRVSRSESSVRADGIVLDEQAKSFQTLHRKTDLYQAEDLRLEFFAPQTLRL